MLVTNRDWLVCYQTSVTIIFPFCSWLETQSQMVTTKVIPNRYCPFLTSFDLFS
jgi:hypothetical protein